MLCMIPPTPACLDLTSDKFQSEVSSLGYLKVEVPRGHILVQPREDLGTLICPDQAMLSLASRST